MKRIGVFGGSFDPIHDGHLAVATGALQAADLDEVILMVSPENPLKKGRLHAPEESRLEMAEAAIKSLPDEFKDRIKVSNFEFGLPRPSYTIDTLLALRKAYPDCSFCWIAGGDNLEIISRWKDFNRILSEFGLIVYPRPDAKSPEHIPMGVKYIDNVKQFPYSSTEIREKLSDSKEVGDLPIPAEVKNYISRHPGLYVE
ncbi:MAG: nicotinate (nicotinamide) nucleotide adenylyltransferase [Muribaculaceae bacterium]|nr:nicotinate (nicotinamide) nucleotide adenylyltransferase [Muribaculaceae bacterium]